MRPRCLCDPCPFEPTYGPAVSHLRLAPHSTAQAHLIDFVGGVHHGFPSCSIWVVDNAISDSPESDYRQLSTTDDAGQWPTFSEPGGVGVSAQRRAWRALYKTYWAIVPLTDHDLRHHADIDLATYNALVHTHLAGPNGIRMKDMAKNASLSTSGLTALVDRLERQGLVQRNPDPHDRRATRITLTDGGLERARQAAHVHIASIESHFASRLTERDATALAETLERIEHDANTTPYGPET